MTELKPCPFCGDTPSFLRSGDLFYIGHREPTDCNIIMRKTVPAAYIEKIIDKWNTRPDPERIDCYKLKCQCGFENVWAHTDYKYVYFLCDNCGCHYMEKLKPNPNKKLEKLKQWIKEQVKNYTWMDSTARRCTLYEVLEYIKEIEE